MTMRSLPSMSASTVIEDPSSGDVTEVLCKESSASDTHLNKAAAPPSSIMNGCPMDVDAKVVEVSLTSSNVVFEDESHTSSSSLNLTEPMYRFANRQRHDFTIKIPKSSYQALLCGRVISYSSHSVFES